MNIHPRRFWKMLGALLLWLAVVSPLRADRAPLRMGQAILLADTIVIADSRKQGALEIILSVREVIKGDAALVGREITFDFRKNLTSSEVLLRGEASGDGFLLKSGEKPGQRWDVLASYQKPEELAALRILTPICDIANERDRLLALKGTLSGGNPLCANELLAQIGQMQVPANFDLVPEIYPALDTAHQVELVKLLGEMGDARAVPVVIEAADSADEKLSTRAVQVLCATFPDAPGVIPALERALTREHLQRAAAEFLVFYRKDEKLDALAWPPDAPWLQAERLLQAGRRVEGRAAFVGFLEHGLAGAAAELDTRIRVNAASKLMADASPEEMAQVRRLLLPILARSSYAEDYLIADEVVEMFGALPHPDWVPVILPVLRAAEFFSTKTVGLAVGLIRDLGNQARETALVQVRDQLRAPLPKSVFGKNPYRYALELLWLGHRKDFEELAGTLHDDFKQAWRELAAFQALADAPDEAAFLIERLSHNDELPGEALQWSMLRLGRLKDSRAIPALVEASARISNFDMAEVATQALRDIGGPEAEAALLALMSSKNPGHVREAATEACLKFQGSRGRTLARRVLFEKEFGGRRAAYDFMAHSGTGEDIPLIAALADFWTGDKFGHRSAMAALERLRKRCRVQAE